MSEFARFFLTVGSFPKLRVHDPETLESETVDLPLLLGNSPHSFWDVRQTTDERIALTEYGGIHRIALLQWRGEESPTDFVKVGVLTGHNDSIRRCASFHDSVGSQYLASTDSAGRTLLYDLESLKQIQSFVSPNDRHFACGHVPVEMCSASSPCFAVGGATAASPTVDVKVYEVNKGVVLRRLSGHTSSVWGLKGSDLDNIGRIGCESLLISGSTDKTVRTWDIRIPNEQALTATYGPSNDETRAFDFVPERHILHVINLQGWLSTFDVRVGSSRKVYPDLLVHPEGGYMYLIERVGCMGDEVDMHVSIGWAGNGLVVWDGTSRKILRVNSKAWNNWGMCCFAPGRGSDILAGPMSLESETSLAEFDERLDFAMGIDSGEIVVFQRVVFTSGMVLLFPKWT